MSNWPRNMRVGLIMSVASWSSLTLAGEPSEGTGAVPDVQADHQSSGLEEIVVTATRREARQQDVPISVSAITSQALNSADVSTVRSLTQVVPGFIGSRNQGVFQPVIRGVGSTGISIGDEPNIATYIDGVYYPESAANFIDLVEVERVEVLRGPQGTTFGRNATGGLINVITPDPSFDFKGRVALRDSRMREDANEVDARTYVTGGLTSTVAADFAGLIRKNDGYLTDLVRGGTLGDQRVIDLRSKLLFEPSDKAKIILIVENFQQSSTTNSNTPVNGDTAGRQFPDVILATQPWTVSLTQVPTLDIRRWNAALKTLFKFDYFNIETITGWQKLDWFQDTDSDSSNIFLGDFSAIFKVKSLTQEIKLASTTQGPLQWLAGGYFYHFDGDSNLDIITSSPSGPTTTLNLLPSLGGRSFAGYADATYEVVPSFFLTAGGRYTTETRHFEQIVNGKNLFGTVDKTFNKFNYRFAARYAVSTKTNVYASYGTAFKSGVYNMAGTSPTPVDPENIKAVELGIKSDPLQWLRTNLSVYHYKYQNLQVQAKAANGVSYILENAADAKIYGGELEVTVAPTRNFSVRGSSAYTHARYADFPGAQSFIPLPQGGNQVVALDASGKVMTRAPKWTFNVGADWGTDFATGRLSVDGNIYYSTTLYYDFQNIFSQGSYALANASVS